MKESESKLVPQSKSVARLQIRPSITLKEAQLALEKLAVRNGCPACGFSGIDVVFEQVIDLANDLRSENVLSARLESLNERAQGIVVTVGGGQ